MKKIKVAFAISLALAAHSYSACIDLRNATASTSNTTLATGTVSSITVGGTRNAGIKGSFYFRLKGSDGKIIQMYNAGGTCIDGIFVAETNDASRDLFFRQVQEAKAKGTTITVGAIDDPSYKGYGQGVVFVLQQD